MLSLQTFLVPSLYRNVWILVIFNTNNKCSRQNKSVRSIAVFTEDRSTKEQSSDFANKISDSENYRSISFSGDI